MTSDSGPRINAALRFAPDGYDVSRPRLVGRHVAGNGFLRAMVAARGDGPVVGYGATADPRPFADFVAGIDPAASTTWIRADDLGALSRVGVCHRPDPMLVQEAQLRLRAGPARYCLTGVTHTIASPGAMGELASLLHQPLMPWDAVVCTSEAVAETVREVHRAERDYLRWRLGAPARLSGPQTPVIPLGVHCEDFAASGDDRDAARRDLGLDADEVAALFVGRLTFGTKAHPAPMFQGLQAAAERTGKRVALILCGWAHDARMEEAFRSGAALLCPDVRLLLVDGREARPRRDAWAGSDLFVSLSDNIQETFGLTPLEAMAAGLPAVVTDWNGYRSTVRDGVDGFRVRTWAPPAGALEHLARAHDAEMLTYERYAWGAAAATSVDMAQLVDRLAALIDDPGLRRRLGEAGRARARSEFDWRHVYAAYQELWAALNARRLAVRETPEERQWVAAAPRRSSRRLEPFEAFGHYPSAHMGPDTRVSLALGADVARWRALAGHLLFAYTYAQEAEVVPIWERLSAGPCSLAELAADTRLTPVATTLAVGTLAKMGLVVLG